MATTFHGELDIWILIKSFYNSGHLINIRRPDNTRGFVSFQLRVPVILSLLAIQILANIVSGSNSRNGSASICVRGQDVS